MSFKRERLEKVYLICGLTTLFLVGALFWTGGLHMTKNADNVFDEMYYTLADPTGRSTTYDNVATFENRITYRDIEFNETDGIICRRLYGIEDLALPCETRFVFVFNPNKECVLFGVDFLAAGENIKCLRIQMRYYVDKKQLYYEPVCFQTAAKELNQDTDRKTVESAMRELGLEKADLDRCKEFLLHEVAIRPWIEGNRGATRFSLENPGKFTIVDNSYQELGW